MFCTKCGKQLGSQDLYCRFCGNAVPTDKLDSEDSRVATGHKDEITLRNPYAGKNKQIYGGLIFLFGLLLLMGTCDSHGDARGLSAVGSLVSIGGLVVYLIGGVEHWYHAE